MLQDIHPRTPVQVLDRPAALQECAGLEFPLDVVCALAGMSTTFAARALGISTHQSSVPISAVLTLLDQDAFSETFVPRSRIPAYLKSLVEGAAPPKRLKQKAPHEIVVGNAVELIEQVEPGSVQCVVTSTPYWGMRVYDDQFMNAWADGEMCALGSEQTPEAFVRHSVEILYRLKPALRPSASLWWNLMDSYNTRTQIRANASETLNAMKGNDSRGWKDHSCRRYSAGHSYLKDGEQCSIPAQVASRASRIGYFVKSTISWKKNGSLPETVGTRVTRELEYILHLSVQRSPFFMKDAFGKIPAFVGGRNRQYESEQLTDVWHFSTASGLDGHGAQYPVALPGRCISLSTKEGDLVLDPFVGSGTTSVAALLLGRRSIGFEISSKYIAIAKNRLKKVADENQRVVPTSTPTPALLRQAKLL